MDFNATIDLIIRDLDEAREIIDDLKKYPGVPVLQVELAKSKCKSAGEVIALLKNLNDESLSNEETEEQDQPLRQKQQEKPEVTIPVVKEVTHASEKPNTPVEDKKTELQPADKANSMVNQKEESQGIKSKSVDSLIIADRFSNKTNSFHDQLAGQKIAEDVSEILKTKQISSLTEAIGLNDKFLFIGEIFKGNKDTYSQAISRLEKATSLTDARAVIMSYTGDNTESEAVLQLLELVKRKLPPNE